MKQLFLTLAVALSGYCSYAQTNTFPTSGNAGLGTTTPPTIGNYGVLALNGSSPSQGGYLSLMTNGTEVGSIAANSQFGFQTASGLVTQFYTGGNPTLQISSTGNVGIGTITPGSDLTVARNGIGISITTVGSGYFGAIALNREAATGAIFNSTASAFQINNGNGTDKNLHIQVYNGSGGQINPDALTISGTATGGVGINIPVVPTGYQFAVNGSAIATSITVKLQNNWPDYVFKKEYRLPSLAEVKTYIDQNHHLPEMPSEAEIVKDGINLGEMNKLLTKKVEELTLYLMQQKEETDKRLQAQQQEIEELKQLLKK